MSFVIQISSSAITAWWNSIISSKTRRNSVELGGMQISPVSWLEQCETAKATHSDSSIQLSLLSLSSLGANVEGIIEGRYEGMSVLG